MRTRGLSLVEVLVVVAVLGILASIIVLPFMSFRKQAALSTEGQELLTLLEKARTYSIASYRDQQYGVHLESSKAVLFAGTTYSATNTNNEVHTLNSLVGLSSITLVGGGSDVVFKRVTGVTDTYGTSTLAVVGDASRAKTLVILPTGVASLY